MMMKEQQTAERNRLIKKLQRFHGIITFGFMGGEFEKALSSAGDFMRSTFGDHVMVIATQHGFDIEEYDHD